MLAKELSGATERRVVKNMWCHQCKAKKPELVCCDNFNKMERHGRCRAKYCSSCVERHYKISVKHISKQEEWHCFKCVSECSCAACRKARKSYEGSGDKRRRLETCDFAHVHNFFSKPLGEGLVPYMPSTPSMSCVIENSDTIISKIELPGIIKYSHNLHTPSDCSKCSKLLSLKNQMDTIKEEIEHLKDSCHSTPSYEVVCDIGATKEVEVLQEFQSLPSISPLLDFEKNFRKQEYILQTILKGLQK